jgi:hypothetical protein
VGGAVRQHQPSTAEVSEDDFDGGGANHTVLSHDERYLFIQNSFLNLEDERRVDHGDRSEYRPSRRQHPYVEGGRIQPNCIMPLPNHFQKGGLRTSAQ